MYIREIQPPRRSPIEEGLPLQGTWTRAFDDVNLLDIKRPFKYPAPRWARDFRIKEWEYFIIQNDQYYLEVMFCNIKFCRMAQVFLWDNKSREKLIFRKVMPFGGWYFPHNLYNSSIDSRSYGFFFRVHNWLYADLIKLDLDIEAAGKRPSFTAHAEFDLAPVVPMAVSLNFAGRRSMYAFKAVAAVRGDMVFGGKHIFLDPARTSGLFIDCKGFYPYRTHNLWCNCMGFDSEGRRYGFSLYENQTRETHKNNENALWLNGELSPLPPVRITMAKGIASDWIIQDVEGMVDLVFSPQEQNRYGLNLLVTRQELEHPLGFYNGMLVSSRGEQIQVRNLWGSGERLYLRI
jgi:hypothetical protein